MNLNSITPFLLHQFKDERDLLKAIEELSVKFTQKREHISDYLKDPRLVSAYTAFYLTTNAPKFEAVLEWMPPGFLEAIRRSTFIDLGAGSGTFSLAFREWLQEKSQRVIQIETSAVMREQAKKLWEGLYPGEELLQSSSSRGVEGAEKFLLFGHSANEMGAETALRYLQDIDPDHVLFIEPGTKDFFPEMLKIRDGLIKKGYEILYPCPLALTCPLQNSTDDWCHQFIQVKQGAEVERLSQMAKKDRRHLPLIVHAFSKTLKREAFDARVIRVFPETKFSFEWEMCEENTIQRYQVMKRGLQKTELKALEGVLSGASVKRSLEKETDQNKRVKILQVNKDPL